ncbi:NCS2 family permease [Salsipaludibacter albus]|uniref:NCS2 family permease n=1 Tax=Salsipaludibacter albus TaxID=2849650 RepID=UPI001EE4CB9B|nr:NCS2 family permease [Salsipaludibacter albus]MBY5164031.1 NCS2 family permease [Salsipaludibacter albus]
MPESITDPTSTATPSSGRGSGLDRYFHVTERGSTISTEVRAGITTFLTMAYIIFVNPSILSNAIDVEGAFPQLLTVTCLAAAFGTLVMALWANLPFALAPGLGLNAYFAFTVVGGLGYSWQTALGAVFVSGLLFLVISLTGLRQWILEAIPLYLKHAITAGIGAFLAIIGFAGAGLIGDSPDTLVTRGDWTSPTLWLAVGGVVLAGALLARRVKGALVIAIVAVTVVAMVSGLEVYPGADGPVAFPGFTDGVVGFTWPSDLVGALDIPAALGTGVLSVVFTFLFVDFFDTAGTLIGLTDKAGMMDEDGTIDAPMPAFAADGLATSVGAVLGTSSTTTYIESAAGVEEGGRTGLASLVVGGLFLLAMVFAPLASVIPEVATAPVLVVIGAMMMTSVTKIDWTDVTQSVPAFLAIVGMPFTYSITDGISLGIIAHVAIMTLAGRVREIRPVMAILAVLVAWRFFVLG